MDLSHDDLSRAVAAGILRQDQAEALWSALEARVSAPSVPRPRFDIIHFAWYFGALIVIGAMGWFMTLGWERLGGAGIFAVAVLYAAVFVATGRTLWRRDGLRIPGGLLITMAVAMTPLVTYGFERALGLWPDADPGNYAGFHEWVEGGWFAMEVATIAAGVIALRWFRFPFLTAPIAFTLWYLSLDLAPLLHRSWDQRGAVSAIVGLVVLVAAFLVDRRTREDFAFWLYLFGLMALWGGLTFMESESALGKLIYFAINLVLMALSLLLRRRAFMVFGAIGTMAYMTYLAHDVFQNSLLFPVVLSFIGIGVITTGVYLHRNAARLEAALLRVIPPSVRSWLPPARERL